MGIQVVTHNGKSPAKGGKRIGYIANNVFSPLIKSHGIVLKKVKPPEAKIKTIHSYYSLDWVSTYRKCKCGKDLEGHKTTLVDAGDVGKAWIIICDCKRMFKHC